MYINISIYIYIYIYIYKYTWKLVSRDHFVIMPYMYIYLCICLYMYTGTDTPGCRFLDGQGFCFAYNSAQVCLGCEKSLMYSTALCRVICISSLTLHACERRFGAGRTRTAVTVRMAARIGRSLRSVNILERQLYFHCI